MKNLIILFLLAGIATGHSQVIHLDEANVTNAAKIVVDGDAKYLILEDYSGEFMENPIGFMKENFDIHLFIEEFQRQGYDSYIVEFKNRKGHLIANFDDKGSLLSTAQRFRDIALPISISRELVRDYKGWAMTKNLYVASGQGDALDRELYRVTLKNGKSSKTIKIIPDRPSRGLASN